MFKKNISILLITLLITASLTTVVEASLYDHFNQELPSVEERMVDAERCGISNYTGTFEQNIELETCLRGDVLGTLSQPGISKSDLLTINTDMKPGTDNVFDLGGEGARWRNVRVGNDLVVDGDLTVQGTTTIINSTTLVVEDKNIVLGNVTTPTDITADGGGITLKADNDITMQWVNATNAWTFNQSIDLLGNNLLSTGNITAGRVLVDSLDLNDNTISSTAGDIDITTFTGGVFKYTSNAFQSGQDASNYLEIGHGGSNSFVNSVGAGNMDFRFAGVNKASFTPAGHLHLKTDTDQKHNLKIITANNANDSGIAWENSGGNFSQTIFRTDVGSNRSDLVFAIGSDANIDLLTNSFKIHGSAANEGRLEVLDAFQISSGSPGLNKVLTSDATGIATWVLPAGGGWTDGGTDIFLTNVNDKVGIGEAGPDTKLHVVDGGTAGVVTAFAGTVATLESPGAGYLSILTPDANERGILFGEASDNNAGGIIYNAATTLDGLEFRVNGDSVKMVIANNGRVGIATGATAPTTALEVVGDNPGNVGGFPSGGLQIRGPGTSANSNAVITLHNSFNGNTQLAYLGSVSSSNQNIALINRQNAELHFHTNDLNRMTIQAGGNVGIGQTIPTEKLEVNGNIKATTIIDNTIFAQLNSSVDQLPTSTQPVVITYNTQDAINGLTHSTTTNAGEITIDTAGMYFVSPQPQVGKDSGGTKIDFDMFLQVNRGSGFVDEANSNIKLSIKDADITDVIVSAFTIQLNVGDKIRMMQRTSSAVVGMGLKNTDPVVGDPTVPRTPSIIFTMYRIGGI